MMWGGGNDMGGGDMGRGYGKGSIVYPCWCKLLWLHVCRSTLSKRGMRVLTGL